jgi:uncharacterized protein (TIGR02722 family)
MHRTHRAAWAALSLIALCLGACSTRVERLDASEVEDISGRWSGTDSQLVSQAMIDDALSHPWVDEFRKERGRKPTIIVGEIRNRTHEHVNTQTFVLDLQRAILNSGEAEFVAGPDEREQIRGERDAQPGYTEESTRSLHGSELGADFMMVGSMDAIVDQEGRRSVVFYQVNLQLVDLKTNRKVWIGEKKIKKYVKRPLLSL